MAVDCLGGLFCFWAPARLRKIATPLSATKTNAQKISIPRDDRCGCFGNWITNKKYAIYLSATAEFVRASSICRRISLVDILTPGLRNANVATQRDQIELART